MLQRSFDQLPVVREQVAPAELKLPAQTVDLREMWRILRRRWRFVAAAPALLVALTLVYCFFLATTLYTATSTVFVDSRHAEAVETNQSTIESSNYGTDDATIDSETNLIQSVAVLQRVIEKLNLTQDIEFNPPPNLLDYVKQFVKTSAPSDASPEDAAMARALDILQRRVKVTRQGTTFLIDINVSSESARKAMLIGNAIADAYLDEQVRAKNDATKTASNWLNGQLEDLKSRVVASEKTVEDFRAANNLAVSQGVTVTDQQLTDLNNQLVGARVQTAEARAKYEQAQQLAKNKGGDPGGINAAISSDVIARLRLQYADIAKNEADLTSKYGPRHPSVANVRAQLRDTQRLIDDEIGRILQSTQRDYDVAQSREASLQSSLDQLQDASSSANQARVRLRELQREAEANRTLYESYLARFKESTSQQSLELPGSHIVTKASIPISPSWPKKMLLLALAGTLGIGIGSVLAFLADYLDQRVKTLEQAEAISGVPALAAVPLISAGELAGRAKRGRSALARYNATATKLLPAPLQPPLMRYAIEAPGTFFAEGIRAVRLALQRTMRSEPIKVVLVTSAIANEGKTTLAANLAQSLAMLGIRTLLVDGDLRNPQLTRSLCPHADLGLLEIAVGRTTVERAVLADPSTGLSILPSTAIKRADLITELMFSDRIVDILDDLTQRYDLIVVDSPPLVPLVDGRALAELADRIVLAVAWDQTPGDVLAHTMDLLSPVHDRILGTVLTRVDMRQLRLYDYYQSSAYIKPYATASIAAEAAQ